MGKNVWPESLNTTHLLWIKVEHQRTQHKHTTACAWFCQVLVTIYIVLFFYDVKKSMFLFCPAAAGGVLRLLRPPPASWTGLASLGTLWAC